MSNNNNLPYTNTYNIEGLTNGTTTIELTSDSTTNYLSKKKIIDINSNIKSSSNNNGSVSGNNVYTSIGDIIMNYHSFDLDDYIVRDISGSIPDDVTLALRPANPEDFLFDQYVDPYGYFSIFSYILNCIYDYRTLYEYLYDITNEYIFDISNDDDRYLDVTNYTVISKPLSFCNAETYEFFFLDGEMECTFVGNSYTFEWGNSDMLALLKFLPSEYSGSIAAKFSDVDLDENNMITAKFEYPTMFFFIVLLMDISDYIIYI